MINSIVTPKKIHRFLVATALDVNIGATITVDDPRISHQIHRVLKLQQGETITVFTDGGPNVTAEIISTGSSSLTVLVKNISAAIPLPRNIVAAISIVKGDNFELIVQKLTEIGIQTIVPLITARTIKQTVRIDRLQVISDEALEQCGGNNRVHITEPLSLKQCFEHYPYESVILDPQSTQTSLKLSDATVVFYVGPEGGWNEQDEVIITAHSPHYVQLTQRVLRTETAAILAAYTLLWL